MKVKQSLIDAAFAEAQQHLQDMSAVERSSLIGKLYAKAKSQLAIGSIIAAPKDVATLKKLAGTHAAEALQVCLVRVQRGGGGWERGPAPTEFP